MNSVLASEILESGKDWIFSISALSFFCFLSSFSAKSVKKFRLAPEWHRIFIALTPIFYLIGLRSFIELAPLPEKLNHWMSGMTYIMEVIFAMAFLRRIFLSFLDWSARHAAWGESAKKGFLPLFHNLINLFAILSAGIMILKYFNYDVMSLITALGVGSLAVGLAAKDTLANMISGFILMIDKNLQPGDRIQMGTVTGDVQKIGLRSTQIKIPNGNLLIVPNAELANTRILNFSLPNSSTLCMASIRVPCEVSFDEIKKICLKLMTQMPFLEGNRFVNLASLAEGHQLIKVGFWISDFTQSDGMISLFLEALCETFRREQIPFVQVESFLSS